MMNRGAVPAALKARYITRLGNALADLNAYIMLCESGSCPQDNAPVVCALAHKLSGSGYTMGFPDISTAAAGLEAILEFLPSSPAAASAARKLVLACHAAIATASAPADAAPLADAAIIAIHDDPVTSRLLAGLETGAVEAGSCQEAAQFLAGGGVRLVIADLDSCPGDALRELYARAAQADVPVLSLTSSRRMAAIAHALGHGRDTCLAKPVDAAAFSATVRALLQTGKRSVILGDDDEIVREFLKARFEAHGFEAILACDGEQVIALARRQPPSIVVLDRAMPKMEGLEVLRMLKADPATHDVPVVMLTQKARPDQISECLGDGASAYMIKPFSPDAVVAKCEEILGASVRARRPLRA